MTDELVKRLRDFDPHLHEWEVVDEAADRIEALTAEREELVECNEQFSVDNHFLKKRVEALTADNARLLGTLTALHKQALMLRGDQSYREFARAVEKQTRAALNTGKEPSHD